MRLASLSGKNSLILLALVAMAGLVFPYPDGKKEHKWAYIDRAGNVVLRLSYPYLGQFHDGRAAFRSGGGGCDWGYLDKTGKAIVAPKCDYAGDYAEGLAAVALCRASRQGEAGFKWGYIDRDGGSAIEFRYDGARPVSEGLAAVAEGQKARLSFNPSFRAGVISLRD